MRFYNLDNLPICQSILAEVLVDYKRPNDKISYMIEKGKLSHLARGYYAFADHPQKNLHLSFNAANTIYGVSYISKYTALSYFGLLAEAVFSVESMTLKRPKSIENKLGRFDYCHTKEDVFHIGIRSININSFCTFLIASPEKALCDIIWNTKKLPISSYHDMKYFLEEDIRFDIDYFKKAKIEIFEECMSLGNKKQEIKYFIRLCKEYQS